MSNLVLFIDDDPPVRRAFARAMRHRGFAIDLAESGEQALQLAQDRSYGVIATDLCLPDIDGLSLIGEIEPLQPHVAYLIVTGLPERVPNVPARKVTDVVLKPWDNQALAQALRRGMQRHRQLLSRGAATTNSVLVAACSEQAPAMLRVLPDDLARNATVRCCQDALNLVGDRDFDAVLMDLGSAPQERVRQLQRIQDLAPHLPVIVMSSLDDEELAVQAILAGAQDVLVKNCVDQFAVNRALTFAIERKRREQRLIYRAHFDQLTGLANRSHFEEQLERMLSRCRRNRRPAAVLFADLDGFKPINDQYGHDTGDLLLQQVAGRLRGLVRDFEPVARLGGDEFAVALSDLSAATDSAKVADRICKELTAPFFVRERRLTISTSIGIASYPEDADSASELIKRADEAMYRAKHGGRSRFCFYKQPIEQAFAVLEGPVLEGPVLERAHLPS
jgi:diguanylate cyclase (GGDEF)-like protein